jgi:hypothetical protein
MAYFYILSFFYIAFHALGGAEVGESGPLVDTPSPIEAVPPLWSELMGAVEIGTVDLAG